MNVAKFVDHTNLKPEATQNDIKKLCKEAVENGFYSVCVNPVNVKLCKNELKNTDVKVAAVVGFPLGQNVPAIKAAEATVCVSDGADEVDMVLNIGALKEGRYNVVLEDIKGVVACGVPVKVIFETCKLTDEEIVKATEISIEAGAAFIKTSTGFLGEGANERVVALMVKTANGRIKVKASGGIRDIATAEKYIELGAERIGASALAKK